MDIKGTSNLTAVEAFRAVQDNAVSRPTPAAQDNNNNAVANAYNVQISQEALNRQAAAQAQEAAEGETHQNTGNQNTNAVEQAAG